MDNEHRIVITMKDLIYDRLGSVSSIDDGDEERESWEGEPATKRLKNEGFSGKAAEFPIPLAQICLNMSRQGDFYSGKVIIIPENSRPVSFKGLSRVLRRNFKPARFIATRRYGLGYIYLPENPGDGFSDFTIGSQDGNYELHLGDAGARERRFTDARSMEADLGQLETVLDIFVKSCYDLTGKSMRCLPKYIAITC